MCVVAAEMIVARQGVGFLIVRGQESGDTALIVVCMLAIGVVSFLLSTILRKMEGVLLPVAVLRDKIVIKNLSKTFASKKNSVEVLKDINLTVKENEFLVILGPGSGKNRSAEHPCRVGRADLGYGGTRDGRPKMGDLGLVFQRYALLPWKSVSGNVEMNQKLKGRG